MFLVNQREALEVARHAFSEDVGHLRRSGPRPRGWAGLKAELWTASGALEKRLRRIVDMRAIGLDAEGSFVVETGPDDENQLEQN